MFCIILYKLCSRNYEYRECLYKSPYSDLIHLPEENRYLAEEIRKGPRILEGKTYPYYDG
jgi:hypothetical protein